MSKKNQVKTAAGASRRHPAPVGNVTEVSLADLVTAYYNFERPRRAIKQHRLDSLCGGDCGLGEVLFATLAATSPPMLGIGEDGKQRIIRNADTIWALASYTASESWARTRVRCRVLSDMSVLGSSCDVLEAIFLFLAGARSQDVERPARRGLRKIRLIHRGRDRDVARTVSVSDRRKR